MELNTLGIVHDFLKRNVHAGYKCIDATAGKGRDTVLLCRLCGEEGSVIAFDIQEEAVRLTKELLKNEGLHAEVFLDSHENMEKYAQSDSIDCIVFNLGRLPGGDTRIFTKPDSSVKAIDSGLRLLKKGGVMVIALYYGGFNGYEEKDAILNYLSGIDNRKYSVLCGSWLNRINDPPMPVFIWKE